MEPETLLLFGLKPFGQPLALRPLCLQFRY